MLKKLALTLAVLTFSFGFMSHAAYALDLASAKKEGLVGELTSGLIGAVPSNPSPELLAFVEATNKGRMAVYKDMSEKQGVVLPQIQGLAAQKLYEKEAPGNYIQINGAWSIKEYVRR